MPTRVSQGLLQHDFDRLYASVLSVADNLIDFASLALLDGQGKLIDPVGIAVDQAEYHKLVTKVFFIDPEQGLLFAKGSTPEDLVVVYHYGFASRIGAGEYDRTAFADIPSTEPSSMTHIQGGKKALISQLATLAPTGALSIDDSLTYDAIEDITGIQNVLVRSHNTARPLLRLPPASGSGRTQWTLTGVNEAELTLEGLFISGGDVVLRGQFKSVTLTSCTFDPGTNDKTGVGYNKSVDGRQLAPSCLWIEGHVETLVVSRCVMGPINERTGDGWMDKAQLSDSIVQAIGPDRAIGMSLGGLDMQRCTVLGKGKVHRLEASDCVFDDAMTVIDDQTGCLRFSAWSTGSRLPRQYACVEMLPNAPVFVSRHFGEPAFAQLAEDADRLIVNGENSAGISAGAESGSAMGAFSGEQYPIKMRALKIKFDEYMPIGMAPVFINVT